MSANGEVLCSTSDPPPQERCTAPRQVHGKPYNGRLLVASQKLPQNPFQDTYTALTRRHEPLYIEYTMVEKSPWRLSVTGKIFFEETEYMTPT